MKFNFLIKYNIKNGLPILFFLLFSKLSIYSQVFTQSNLPIVIINTDNSQGILDEPRVLGTMKIIYNGPGVQNYVSNQTNPLSLNYNGRIDIEIRGSSSQALDKKGYGLTTRMADNVTNNNVSLLGMPSENDWILNGLAFDPSLIRDYISYEISRNMGNYAPRTVFCELIVNGDYRGLYLLQEKIKADSQRVNITKITTTQNTLPELSGGYITKSDKDTGGDPVAWTMSSYVNGNNANFIHDLPKPEEVTTQQNTYIQNEFYKLANTSAVNNTSIINGYPSVIDVPTFVDFMLSNELGSNADGYHFSTYFHKERNGKLRAGPVWDFNLTYGNDLFLWGFDRSHTDVWQFSDGGNDGAKFWKDLFLSPQFKCYFSKRWNEVTQVGKPMNLNTLYNLIDTVVTYITPAIAREETRWGSVGNHLDQINGIKTFLSDRIIWMNSNIGGFSSCNSVVTPPLVITKINYNPVPTLNFTSNDQEFIEIKNIGNQVVNLSGIYFSGLGLTYQFPANGSLAANSSLYLVSKSTTFFSRYGINAFGEFYRNLSNSNQNLILSDAFGNKIDQVFYYDSAPWPTNADGGGSYLQLISTALDNNIGSSWIASNTLSIQDVNSENQLYISPNPTSDYITIMSKNNLVKIEIYDLEGRLIQSINEVFETCNVDLTEYSNGIYIFKIDVNGISTIKKIIKK
ncbi:Secretion system C-terminal sorting domain [Flavobacteriaceae bacterium]